MFLERQMNILLDKETKYIFYSFFFFFNKKNYSRIYLMLAVNTENRESSKRNVLEITEKFYPIRKKQKETS